MSSTYEDITKTIIKLLLKEPFYGHFVTHLIKHVSDELPTLGVKLVANEMVQLSVNEDFWRGRLTSPDLRYGAIKHEVLHIIFKHILLINDVAHPKIFNVAADLVVNQYIKPNQLLDGALSLSDFPELNLEPEQGVHYYYDRLLQLYNQQLYSPQGDKPDAEAPNRSWQTLKGCLEDDVLIFAAHKPWKNALSQAEKRLLDAMIEDMLVNTLDRVKNQQFGDLPGGLRRYIKELMERRKPQINWRRALKLFTHSSSRTRIQNTIKKASKRYGTVPGIRIRKKNKLLVAIDTSGSINQEELGLFFSELYHIHKEGAEIRVVECDTALGAQYDYKGRTPEFVTGGGGTDFNAPLAFANEVFTPDAIIYFTDGYAAAPEVTPRAPVMWMITREGIAEDSEAWSALKGRKVKMRHA